MRGAGSSAHGVGTSPLKWPQTSCHHPLTQGNQLGEAYVHLPMRLALRNSHRLSMPTDLRNTSRLPHLEFTSSRPSGVGRSSVSKTSKACELWCLRQGYALLGLQRLQHPSCQGLFMLARATCYPIEALQGPVSLVPSLNRHLRPPQHHVSLGQHSESIAQLALLLHFATCTLR